VNITGVEGKLKSAFGSFDNGLPVVILKIILWLWSIAPDCKKIFSDLAAACPFAGVLRHHVSLSVPVHDAQPAKAPIAKKQLRDANFLDSNLTSVGIADTHGNLKFSV